MEQVSVNYGMISLVVVGDYYPGSIGDYMNPPDPKEFNIHKVYVESDSDKTDISELIAEHALECLELQALEFMQE